MSRPECPNSQVLLPFWVVPRTSSLLYSLCASEVLGAPRAPPAPQSSPQIDHGSETRSPVLAGLSRPATTHLGSCRLKKEQPRMHSKKLDHSDIPLAWSRNELIDAGTLDACLADSDLLTELITGLRTSRGQTCSLPSSHHNPHNPHNPYGSHNPHNPYLAHNPHNPYGSVTEHLSKREEE